MRRALILLRRHAAIRLDCAMRAAIRRGVPTTRGDGTPDSAPVRPRPSSQGLPSCPFLGDVALVGLVTTMAVAMPCRQAAHPPAGRCSLAEFLATADRLARRGRIEVLGTEARCPDVDVVLPAQFLGRLGLGPLKRLDHLRFDGPAEDGAARHTGAGRAELDETDGLSWDVDPQGAHARPSGMSRLRSMTCVRYSPERSMRTARRDNDCATMPVVPDPAKGSRTVAGVGSRRRRWVQSDCSDSSTWSQDGRQPVVGDVATNIPARPLPMSLRAQPSWPAFPVPG